MVLIVWSFFQFLSLITNFSIPKMFQHFSLYDRILVTLTDEIMVILFCERSVVHSKGKVKQSLQGPSQRGDLPPHTHFQGSLCGHLWILISSVGLLVPTGVLFVPKTMLGRYD